MVTTQPGRHFSGDANAKLPLKQLIGELSMPYTLHDLGQSHRD